MTLKTTNRELAAFAVGLAALRTGWPTEVKALDDGGWYVRNGYIELSESEIRDEYTRAKLYAEEMTANDRADFAADRG